MNSSIFALALLFVTTSIAALAEEPTWSGGEGEWASAKRFGTICVEATGFQNHVDLGPKLAVSILEELGVLQNCGQARGDRLLIQFSAGTVCCLNCEGGVKMYAHAYIRGFRGGDVVFEREWRDESGLSASESCSWFAKALSSYLLGVSKAGA